MYLCVYIEETNKYIYIHIFIHVCMTYILFRFCWCHSQSTVWTVLSYHYYSRKCGHAFTEKHKRVHVSCCCRRCWISPKSHFKYMNGSSASQHNICSGAQLHFYGISDIFTGLAAFLLDQQPFYGISYIFMGLATYSKNKKSRVD